MSKRKTARVRKSLPRKQVRKKKTISAQLIPATGAPPGRSPELVKRIQELNRQQAALDRAIRAQREKTLTAYRARLSKFREGEAKHIFAEGDSWFNYPLGYAIIDQLQDLIKMPIANFAWPGAETRELLGVDERKEIEKRLKDGPGRGKKWDILLFSGGGDDIVGAQMVLFLDRYDSTKPPEAVVSARFNEVLDLVMDAYRDLVALRDNYSCETILVGHVYDYPWATNKGACWLGPWLRPSLDYVGVPAGAMQHAVLIEMLKRFEARLTTLASAAGNFVVVLTHDTLKTEQEWDNELHPKDAGFHQLAVKFQGKLQPYL